MKLKKPIKLPKKPKKESILQFVYYNFGGIAFFVSGYAVFALLYGLLHWHWLIAKGIADLTGWALNYLIQRYLAFRHEARQLSQKKLLKKYIAFSLLNVVIDYLLVGGLKLVGVSPFLGLWISSLFFTVWKFIWYKLWVFREKQPSKS